jgi:hypothetical protein
VSAGGGCLCGAVRYEVRGPLRDVLVCHCVECRRWSGHLFAATAARREDVLSIATGSLDPPTGLGTAAHVYVRQAADYCALPADGLPRHAGLRDEA